MRPDEEPRYSWICHDEFERARFMDLHSRLLRANRAIMLILILVIGAAAPFVPDRIGLLPAGLGMVLFGGIQRNATRFARPELWVFAGLLGAESMIVLAISSHHGLLSPAMALLCWPVAGLAGRFPDRASWLATMATGALVGGAILATYPDVMSSDPLALPLLLVALAAVHTMSTVLRDSDVEHRGAAIIDPLTGMLNRAALMNRTLEIEHQSRLTGEPVAVIVADIDRFKRVNDTHGHPAGDAVLLEIAHRMRRELRAYDLAYRLGGEEFVVLLLGATPHAAAALAEQLREAIANAPIAGIHITVSLGVAASPPGSTFVWAEVFARADAALYRAKADGRDRVCAEGPGARGLVAVPS